MAIVGKAGHGSLARGVGEVRAIAGLGDLRPSAGGAAAANKAAGRSVRDRGDCGGRSGGDQGHQESCSSQRDAVKRSPLFFYFYNFVLTILFKVHHSSHYHHPIFFFFPQNTQSL